MSLRIEKMPQVASVRSPFRSLDNDASLILAWLRTGLPEASAAASVAHSLEQRPGVFVGGAALAKEWLSKGTGRDLQEAEVIVFPLLVILGVWVFRSLIAALMPAVVGGSTLFLAFACLRSLTNLYPLSIYCLSIVSALALGLAVDYSLLMVSRYREELAFRVSAREAACKTIRTAGRTVAISSATIAAAFTTLLLIPVPFVRSIGAGGASAAVIAGAMALLVLPALFQLLGRRIDKLSFRVQVEGTELGVSTNIWSRLARLVMQRPVLIAATTGTFLVLVAVPALDMRFTSFDETSLPTDSPQRRFSELLQREFEHPLVDELRIAVSANGEKAAALQGKILQIAEGSGVATPFPTTFAFGSSLFESRLSPLPSTYSPAAQQLVKRVRAINGPIAVGGRTAAYVDLVGSLKRNLPYAFLALALILFPFLLLATRSVVLFIKVLVMNVLSIGAAFGLLVIIFQGGLMEDALGYRSQSAFVVALPVVMAVGCFGLVTDYGLFLLMRVREARETGCSDRDAIAIGLERTGPIVTAAAVLFSVAVAAFITSDVVLVKEVAVGIIAAVIIDAFVVRPLLVPSLMMIFGRWNWWPFGMPAGQQVGALRVAAAQEGDCSAPR